MIRTRLGKFCEELELLVLSVQERLRAAARLLAATGDGPSADDLRERLGGTLADVEALTAETVGRHSNVCVLGPLKSGKSSLVDALLAAYATKVTSLPTYPCLVRLGHAPEWTARIERYDGTEETFHDPASMRLHIQRSHSELIDRVLDAEAAGHVFDPEIHYREALREVEVRVPLQGLAGGGVQVAEVPGHHDRIRIDRDAFLTRLAKGTTAALFVVRSDDPFPGRVFEAFAPLLERFERIFLVVNLDSARQELTPDGRLVPAAEDTDPERVVAAFEGHAMPAAVKRAADEGRVRVYALDLLRLAAARLSGYAGAGPWEETLAALESDVALHLDGDADAARFRTETVQRTGELLARCTEISGSPSAESVRRRLERMVDECEDVRSRLGSMDRLNKVSEREWEWEEAFAPLLDRVRDLAERRAKELAGGNASSVSEVVGAWMRSDASLGDFVDDDLTPLFSACRRSLAGFVHGLLIEETTKPATLSLLSGEVLADLEAAELPLEAFAKKATEGLEPATALERTSTPLASDEPAVRHSLVDRLLFRGRTKVRARLFGPEETPVRRANAREKTRRLGTDAAERLSQAIVARLEGQLVAAARKIATNLFREFVTSLCDGFRSAIQERVRHRSAPLAAVETEIEELRLLDEELATLGTSAETARRALDELTREADETGPEDEPERNVPRADAIEEAPAEEPDSEARDGDGEDAEHSDSLYLEPPPG